MLQRLTANYRLGSIPTDAVQSQRDRTAIDSDNFTIDTHFMLVAIWGYNWVTRLMFTHISRRFLDDVYIETMFVTDGNTVDLFYRRITPKTIRHIFISS